MNKEKGGKLDILIKNTVSLQEILADLAIDVNSLTKDIKQMLGLFNEAKEAFEEGKAQISATAGGDMATKMNQLIEQNKTIAKGIVLLESFLKEKTEEIASSRPKPLPEYR